MNSKTTATGVITDPDTPEAALAVEIQVQCSLGGAGTVRIPGHHLRLVRDIATEYCDRYPELTKSDIRLITQTQFDNRTAPKRPEDN